MAKHRGYVVLVTMVMILGLISVPATGRPSDEERTTSEPPMVVRRPGDDVSHLHAPLPKGGPRRPAVKDNFDVLSHVPMPGQQGTADVYFFDHGNKGKFAYVGSFREPCTTDGVRIVDVTRPRGAHVAAIAELPSRWRTSVEDVTVERIGNRTVLAGGLQACKGRGKNGLALWDVTRPTKPRLLTFLRTPSGVHELDLAVRTDGTVLALLATPFVEFSNTYFGTDNGGELRIVDVTKPRRPDRLSTWGIIADSDLVTLGGDPIVSSFQGMDTFYTAIYAHSVRDADDGTTAYISYWDAGVVKLDISNPYYPTFVGRTFYEVGDAGDGHSMYPLDVGGTRYVIQNDEDYNPDSPVSVTSSATGSTEFGGMHEPWMPQTLWDTGPITGDVWDAGDGCQKADYSGANGNVALVDTVDPFYDGIIEGWTVPCSFANQIRRATANGATALVSNLVSPDDPYPFPYELPNGIAEDEDMVVVQISDADGLADDLRAAPGTPTITLDPTTPAVGYVRIFDESQLVDSDGDGQAQEFKEVATFTEPEHVFGELSPPANGTWSVHNTEVRADIAYSSWYSHGIVAWDLSTVTAPTQVGQFRPRTRKGWPHVWGVAVDPETGIVYASDIFSGLWVVRPTGPASS